MPLALGVVGNPSPDWKVELALRGGYVSAKQTTAGETGSVSTTTDSQFSGTVTYTGINGIQPFAGLVVNVPTGKSALYGDARFARMDGDLVDVGSFGEGWNFGPTVGFNIPITPNLLLTISGGYTSRGKFDKEGPDPVTGEITATDHVKNGDDATLTFGLGYTDGPFSIQATISEAWSGVSQVNEPFVNNYQKYRAGTRTTATGVIAYQWNQQWSSTVTGFYNHSERNSVLDFTDPTFTTLVSEAFNTNSDIYKIGTDLTYRDQSGWSLGPTVSYLHRNTNWIDPLTFGFVPAKTRWSAGAVANYTVSNSINVNGRVEHVWIRENENPGPPAFAPIMPAQSGDGWVFALGATVAFQ
jgi:hypothetical protein